MKNNWGTKTNNNTSMTKTNSGMKEAWIRLKQRSDFSLFPAKPGEHAKQIFHASSKLRTRQKQTRTKIFLRMLYLKTMDIICILNCHKNKYIGGAAGGGLLIIHQFI